MKILSVIIFAVFLLLTVIFVKLPSGLWSADAIRKDDRRYLRIVALAPSFTETMVALDQGHRLVGITIHCQMEGLAHAQKIGSFAEPNFEAIMALSPDLVLAVPHVMAKRVLEKLVSNNVEVFAHQPDSLTDIKFITVALAEKLGIKSTGVALNQKIDQALARARQKVLTLDVGLGRKTTLIAVSHLPFVVAGKNTFASEIVEELGLINMADDPKAAWPVWPVENLLSKPPQLLILADGKENLHRYHKLFVSLGLDITANTMMRLIVPDRPIFNSPSPTVIEDTLYLTRLLQSGV